MGKTALVAHELRGMKRKKNWFFGCVLWLLLLFVVKPLGAAPWTVDDLPMVYLQDARRFTTNPEGVLSTTTVDSIDAALYDLEQRTGVQTVVIAVKQIENDDPYGFAMALAEKYKIGQKERDNGLIILLATEDRSYHILTGRGLEGTLPDAICKRIENRIMLPALKVGDWDAAMLGAVKSAVGYILGDPTQLQALNPNGEDGDGSVLVAFFFAFGFVMLVILVTYFQNNKRCPNCGKRFSYKRSTTQQRLNASQLLIKERWTCTNCGHSERNDRTMTIRQNRNSSGSGLGGPIIFPRGGGFGNFPSGGGFSGGSFGGGSFGGGGAGGRF